MFTSSPAATRWVPALPRHQLVVAGGGGEGAHWHSYTCSKKCLEYNAQYILKIRSAFLKKVPLHLVLHFEKHSAASASHPLQFIVGSKCGIFEAVSPMVAKKYIAFLAAK